MEEQLNQIKENLDAAYNATERVPASGAALDSLAQARMFLRAAYAAAKTLLKEAEKEEEKNA